MRGIRGRLILLAAATIFGSSGFASADRPAELQVTLRPVVDEAGEVGRVDVAVTVDAPDVMRFSLPRVVSNVVTIADLVTEIEAADSQGPLPLSVADEGDADTGSRVWIPQRPAEGPLTIRYRAPIDNRIAARGAAPPLELRREDGAVSGAGSTFLILPETEDEVRLSLRWDLSALPDGASAASSLGIGDVAIEDPQPVSRLERSFFMAGSIGRYPADEPAGAFFAAWQGAPPFDAVALMAWTARLHERYADFFEVTNAPAYAVFLRPNPVNAGGGVGLEGSFVATFGAGTEADDLRGTLAHEMFHTFSPRLAEPGGLESSWFTEGLAVHYQRVLPFRFGEIGPGEFLESLNRTAGRYYTSAMAEVPNSEVPGRFWEDTRIRTLPYDRGALYFADLDHRLRLASGGRRSLDDLMLAMLERQRRGEALGYDDWEELLRESLGQAGVDHFRAMLAGTPPLPASDAFGPCFRRTTVALRRYELGFAPRVLVEQPRIVRGLVAGSAAEQAGLRNGDEIARPVPQDSIQGDQTALLRLEIRRSDRVFPLAYLPRGETVEAYQWERVEGMSDSECGFRGRGERG